MYAAVVPPTNSVWERLRYRAVLNNDRSVHRWTHHMRFRNPPIHPRHVCTQPTFLGRRGCSQYHPGGEQGAVRAASWRGDIGPVGNKSRRGRIRGTAHYLRTLQHDSKFRYWVAKVMKELFLISEKYFLCFWIPPKVQRFRRDCNTGSIRGADRASP